MRKGAAAGARVWAPIVLLLGALMACAPVSDTERQTVVVTIRHSRFHPSLFSFPEGTRVRFVIRNTDPIDHEFIVGDRSVQERHERGTERGHGSVPGEVGIPAGEERVTTLTLSEPGTVLIGCHLPGHYAYGMRGEIQVVA